MRRFGEGRTDLDDAEELGGGLEADVRAEVAWEGRHPGEGVFLREGAIVELLESTNSLARCKGGRRTAAHDLVRISSVELRNWARL